MIFASNPTISRSAKNIERTTSNNLIGIKSRSDRIDPFFGV